MHIIFFYPSDILFEWIIHPSSIWKWHCAWRISRVGTAVKCPCRTMDIQINIRSHCERVCLEFISMTRWVVHANSGVKLSCKFVHSQQNSSRQPTSNPLIDSWHTAVGSMAPKRFGIVWFANSFPPKSSFDPGILSSCSVCPNMPGRTSSCTISETMQSRDFLWIVLQATISLAHVFERCIFLCCGESSGIPNYLVADRTTWSRDWLVQIHRKLERSVWSTPQSCWQSCSATKHIALNLSNTGRESYQSQDTCCSIHISRYDQASRAHPDSVATTRIHTGISALPHLHWQKAPLLVPENKRLCFLWWTYQYEK